MKTALLDKFGWAIIPILALLSHQNMNHGSTKLACYSAELYLRVSAKVSQR